MIRRRHRGRIRPWRRLAAPVAFLCALAVVPTAPAFGNDDPVDKALSEIERARGMVIDSQAKAADGETAAALDLARSAYLDHFEYAEIPLRLRDPELVLDLEFKFAALRDAIEAGASHGQIREAASAIFDGLDDCERAITKTGIAAPLAAFGFSFAILFREGLEAVLLIGILLSSLEAARAADYRRGLGWGIGAAILASIVTFVLAQTLLSLAPVDRELIEGTAALLSVVVLFFVSFWIVQRLEHRRWMEFMRSRVSAAAAVGGTLAFAGLGFTAIYREGLETALFYQSLVIFAEGLILWVVLGALSAVGALVAAAFAILKSGRKLPLKPLLIGGASTLLLLSVTFAGNAVRALQEGDLIGLNLIQGDWARLPIFVAEVTGIHPTVEGIAVQATLLGIYVAGAIWFFAIRPNMERRRPQPEQVIG